MSAQGFHDITGDWESLLAAWRKHAELLPGGEALRALLEERLQQAKMLKERQVYAAALRQEATQELRKVMQDGRAQVIALRHLAKAVLGHKSELLTQLGATPIRPRRRRTPTSTD